MRSFEIFISISLKNSTEDIEIISSKVYNLDNSVWMFLRLACSSVLFQDYFCVSKSNLDGNGRVLVNSDLQEEEMTEHLQTLLYLSFIIFLLNLS